MPDANTLADQLSTAFEGLFGSTYKDLIDQLVAQRAAMGPDHRARLFAALHKLQDESVNTLAALSRDAAW
jgi:hypothetical protein